MEESQEYEFISCDLCLTLSDKPHSHDQRGNPVKFCDMCYNYYPYENVRMARYICLNACDTCVNETPNLLMIMHEFTALYFKCVCCLKNCRHRSQIRYYRKEINLIRDPSSRVSDSVIARMCENCVEAGGNKLLENVSGRTFAPEIAARLLRKCREYVKLRKNAITAVMTWKCKKDPSLIIGSFLV